MPLLGWLHSSAAGFPVVLFGVLPLPNLVAADKALADTLGFAHWIGGWALVALIVGHAGAALWHHYKLRDDVLQRMLPGASSRNVASWLMGGVIATMLVTPTLAGDPRSWTLEDASKFTFTAKQVNVPIAGEFKSFIAKIQFDPAKPETARIELNVDAASITTGNPQADQLLPGADWFAVAEHPQATFNATGFTATGGDTYDVAGELTLKGTAQPVTVTATITVADHPDDPARLRATASGSATISRTAFKIGQGQWADTNTIADEVVVAFEFTAHSAK
jgi:polyisoprenoid-binding protein YceI